jgi:hypothetical protein
MRHLLIGVLALLFVPFAAAAELMFALPKGAIDASHVVLQPVTAEQDYFWLNDAYPSSSAMDHYTRVFAKWRPCRGSENGWSSFGDHSGLTDQFVHQYVRHWLSRSGDVAVTVLLKYTSPGLGQRERPDSDRQFVVVLRHGGSKLSAELASIGVSCEAGT